MGRIPQQEVGKVPLNSFRLPGRWPAEIGQRHVHTRVAMGTANRDEGGAMIETLVVAHIKAPCGKDLRKALQEEPLLLLPRAMLCLWSGRIRQGNVERA